MRRRCTSPRGGMCCAPSSPPSPAATRPWRAASWPAAAGTWRYGRGRRGRGAARRRPLPASRPCVSEGAERLFRPAAGHGGSGGRAGPGLRGHPQLVGDRAGGRGLGSGASRDGGWFPSAGRRWAPALCGNHGRAEVWLGEQRSPPARHRTSADEQRGRWFPFLFCTPSWRFSPLERISGFWAAFSFCGSSGLVGCERFGEGTGAFSSHCPVLCNNMYADSTVHAFVYMQIMHICIIPEVCMFLFL